jgi:hypothetical protein
MFKYGIIENLETTRRIRIGRFWGVNLLITPIAWLGPFVFFGLHFILNLLSPRLRLDERLIQSMYFVLAVELTTIIHAFGHILSGKLVHSAMDELLITTTRDVNLYHGDQSQIPGYVHLVRSLGGPVLNILIGILCIFFAKWMPSGFWSTLNTSLLSTNLFFGLGGLLPIPSVDGQVIWREVIKALGNK